jgi:hypothetical protein
VKYLTALILIPFCTNAAAQVCEALSEYPTELNLCECRKIENDIERLLCFDKEAAIDAARRGLAEAMTEQLSRQKYGPDAMRAWVEANP